MTEIKYYNENCPYDAYWCPKYVGCSGPGECP